MSCRRGLLLLPLGIAAGCVNTDPPPPTLATLETTLPEPVPYPRPLLLNVVRIEIAPIEGGSAFLVVPPAPINPSDAMVAMARERLRAVGGTRAARFVVRTARFGRHPGGTGGLLTGRTNMLHCTLRCMLDIFSPEDNLLGSAKAEVQHGATVPASSPAELEDSSMRFMRAVMAHLGQEFENAVRRDLGAFLAPGPGPA